MKWTPDLIIALLIVIGCIALLVCHIDSDVKSILAMAAGWAFRSGYVAKKQSNGGT
jgi:hypothetical protein